MEVDPSKTTTGSNPKHDIYAFLICNWIVMWKGRKQTKLEAVMGPFYETYESLETEMK